MCVVIKYSIHRKSDISTIEWTMNKTLLFPVIKIKSLIFAHGYKW